MAPPGVVERLPGARSLYEAYLSNLLAGVLASSPNVVLYNPADALCPTKGLCPRQRNGYLLYSDGNHLSTYGAIMVMDDFVAFLNQPNGNRQAGMIKRK